MEREWLQRKNGVACFNWTDVLDNVLNWELWDGSVARP